MQATRYGDKEQHEMTSPSFGVFARARYFYYLPIAFVRIAHFALTNLHDAADLRVIRFMLLSPVLFALGFRGSLSTPFGQVVIGNRDKMRSVVYGVFKTHFSYLKEISTIPKMELSHSTVVDVGANVGDFTLAMAPFSKRVIALEPGDRNFSSLESNLAINGIKNVVTLNAAAHDRSEEVVLTGIDSMLRIADQKDGQRAKGITLDQVFLELKVSFVEVLKVDVQGHEENVIKGMKRSLENCQVGLVAVEVHPIRGTSISRVRKLMGEYGYALVKQTRYLFGQPHLYFRPVQEAVSLG